MEITFGVEKDDTKLCLKLSNDESNNCNFASLILDGEIYDVSNDNLYHAGATFKVIKKEEEEKKEEE